VALKQSVRERLVIGDAAKLMGCPWLARALSPYVLALIASWAA
jgi:hypothetical protein